MASTQCLGTTKAGKRCEKREKGAYCSQHKYQSGVPVPTKYSQCVGFLDSGERCPRKMDGLLTCWEHVSQKDNVVAGGGEDVEMEQSGPSIHEMFETMMQELAGLKLRICTIEDTMKTKSGGGGGGARGRPPMAERQNASA